LNKQIGVELAVPTLGALAGFVLVTEVNHLLATGLIGNLRSDGSVFENWCADSDFAVYGREQNIIKVDWIANLSDQTLNGNCIANPNAVLLTASSNYCII